MTATFNLREAILSWYPAATCEANRALSRWSNTMIACFDVHYFRDTANAATILFQDWESPASISEYTATVPQSAEYEPGRFYLRELQPLLAVIRKIVEPVDTYVIDGYCHLSSDQAPGLGAYLKESLDHDVSIVGVAKNRYRNTNHAAELLRAQSSRPLFITAIGSDYEVAARQVASMAGEYRIPTLLKAVDRLSRTPPKSGTGIGEGAPRAGWG